MPFLLHALVLGTVWLAGGVPPAPAGDPVCTCAQARELNGWCHLHELGFVAAVPIRSPLLYELLDAHGHVLDLSTFECPACRRAIEEEGFCEEHRVGFARDLAYFSRLTYELARGESLRPEDLSCPQCRRHSESHGWCDRCRRGIVGRIAVRDRLGYEAAVDALEILALANTAAERCPYCAMAIVTNTECPLCRITYRDGEALPGAGATGPVVAEDGPGDRP